MINVEEIYIVNYCHMNCEPLKNIMRLPKEKAYELAYAMAEANKDVTAFGRFADFEKYYPERLETDCILYESFVDLGGKPMTEHPLSFVLQGSEMLDNWFDKGIVTRIPLHKIPSECISFTYGDSMTTLRRNGKVDMITKDMLLKILEEYQGTIGDFIKEVNEKYNYMEVQLWGDKYLEDIYV